MPNRLLTLVLCLLVLMPQQPCACHWVGCHGSPASGTEGGNQGARTCGCTESTDPVSDSAAVNVPAVGEPGCPCCCHSHPCSDPSDCPHAAIDAVADPPKPVAAGVAADLPLPFLSFTIPAERSALLGRLHAPPRAHPVPFYITFCSLRN